MTRQSIRIPWAKVTVLVVFVAAALVLAAASGGPVTGEARVTFGPYGAQVSCSSGTPTFLAWPPCPTGSKTSFKNLLIVTYQDFKDSGGNSIPGLSGFRSTYYSGRLDPDGAGKISGSFEITVDNQGGTWSGTLSGVSTGWFSPLAGSASARGTDGAAKGGRLSFDFSQEAWPEYQSSDPGTGSPKEFSKGSYQIR